MSWLSNLFARKSKTPSEKGTRWLEGRKAFEQGKKFYEHRQDKEALTCFDKALENGFEYGVFELRAFCLQALGYDLDAIDDFTRAIAESPDDCNLYFARAMSKNGVDDFQGSVDDLEKAVELSKVDNDLNQSYRASAMEQGSKDGHTGTYGMQLIMARTRLNRELKEAEVRELLNEEKKIKTYKRR